MTILENPWKGKNKSIYELRDKKKNLLGLSVLLTELTSVYRVSFLYINFFMTKAILNLPRGLAQLFSAGSHWKNNWVMTMLKNPWKGKRNLFVN